MVLNNNKNDMEMEDSKMNAAQLVHELNASLPEGVFFVEDRSSRSTHGAIYLETTREFVKSKKYIELRKKFDDFNINFSLSYR